MSADAIDSIVELRSPKPEVRKSVMTRNNKRVVVVCPYDSFRKYFNFILPEKLRVNEVDMVRDVIMDYEPYLIVDEREGGRVRPDYVIDFGSLIVNGNPTRVVDFFSYREWARGQEGIVLLKIKEDVYGRLVVKHSFDYRGNFEQESVGAGTIKNYRNRIEKDLELVLSAHPKDEDFSFFDARFSD